MKKIIITICIALTALPSMAQSPLSFYTKAGIGTSNFYGKHSGSETKIAYKASVGAKYKLNQTWSLQSALEFVSMGGKDEIEHIGKADMNEHYIQLPVTIVAHLNLGNSYQVSLNAGPFIGLGIGGKTSGEKYDYSSSIPQTNNRFEIGTFGSMMDGKMGNNRFDAGIHIGLTFEYHKFTIGAETQIGMIIVNKQINQLITSEGYNEYLPKNMASFFTIGYRIW